MVDEDRVTWVRVFSIPCHAWNPKFFEFISKLVGKLICFIGVTNSGAKIDVTRLLVRTRCAKSIDEVLVVNINGVKFKLKLVEDTLGRRVFIFLRRPWRRKTILRSQTWRGRS